jgi:hypothetical protein
MCRSIERLFNVDPSVAEDEICTAAVQFVRKISGFTTPSNANEQAFLAAADAITGAFSRLLGSLETRTPPRPRATPWSLTTRICWPPGAPPPPALALARAAAPGASGGAGLPARPAHPLR